MSDSVREPSLQLGSRRDDGAPALLPVRALLRHVIALGSSGSGKTVFCKVMVEEAVRHGIPVIAIDPQGDLASLALGPPPDAELAAQGGDVAIARELRDKADVVVFTPASSKGVPLCADPVGIDIRRLPPDERAHAISRTASRIAALLGYDLDSDEGSGVLAVLDRCLTELIDAGRPADNLGAVIEHLSQLGDDIERYARYLDPKRIRAAIRRAARLDVGARRLLFHDGVPIDIDTLLGRSGPAATPDGKTRVSVIYLNTLHDQEDKEFIVAAIADRLYSWMLRNPSPTLQALFYIDEVAPFIPPVRKPSCKEDLELVFKQARKFGVGCLIATQNPGDVDYKSLSQFGTWAIGRLATRQDLKKIEPALRSVAGPSTDAIVTELPGLKPGNLVMVAPDHFDAPCALATRRLATVHQTLDETIVERLARARWHQRFAPLYAPRAKDASLGMDATLPAWAVPIDRAAEKPRAAKDKPRAAKDKPQAAKDKPHARSEVAATPASHSESAVIDHIGLVLASKLAMTTDEVARKAGVSGPKARAALKALVATGHAGTFREGRVIKYWSKATGARPDLGMKAQITAAQPIVDRAAAERIAHTLLRSKVLGLIGENEVFADAQLVYRLLYRVMFEEQIKKSLLARMVGPTHEQRLGSVYLHPRTLAVLEFSNGQGLRFATELPPHASDVKDLDGMVQFDELRPADIAFDEHDWQAKREPAEAKQHVRRLFGARPGAVAPVFVPLWKLILSREAGASFRVVMIDGIVGQITDWPAE
ncbi:MAG TPA: helicase HerA-like domain-containing protein [Kofleriaceae bacterium]